VFADKTEAFTANSLRMMSCYVGGKFYGKLKPDGGDEPRNDKENSILLPGKLAVTP
jgi:hypothetical protein